MLSQHLSLYTMVLSLDFQKQTLSVSPHEIEESRAVCMFDLQDFYLFLLRFLWVSFRFVCLFVCFVKRRKFLNIVQVSGSMSP